MNLREVDIMDENIVISDERIVLVDDEVIRKYIDRTMDHIIEKKKQRKLINEEIQAVYIEAESRGINRKGLKAALSRYELSEEQRDAMDLTYALCCNVKKVGFQSNLFEHDD